MRERVIEPSCARGGAILSYGRFRLESPKHIIGAAVPSRGTTARSPRPRARFNRARCYGVGRALWGGAPATVVACCGRGVGPSRHGLFTHRPTHVPARRAADELTTPTYGLGPVTAIVTLLTGPPAPVSSRTSKRGSAARICIARVNDLHGTSVTEDGGKLQRLRGSRPARQAARRGRELVFPSPDDSTKEIDRHVVQDWWRRAAKLAVITTPGCVGTACGGSS